MGCPSKCDLCEHESKMRLWECGPDTFGKTKERWICRGYECNAFSEAHLYPGETMPERKKEDDIPDFEFSPEDKQPLFEAEEAVIEGTVEAATKKTPAKKSVRKKAEKK